MHKLVLEKLRAKRTAAVMIGDEPLVDIEIPKRMGLRTIFLARSGETHVKPKEADARATSLLEAVAIVEQWLE